MTSYHEANDFVSQPPLPPPPAEFLTSPTAASPSTAQSFPGRVVNGRSPLSSTSDDALPPPPAFYASKPKGFRSVAAPKVAPKVAPKKSSSSSSETVETKYEVQPNRIPSSDGNVSVTPERSLPEGSVYQTTTTEGELIHTDTYFPAPDGEKVLERTKTTTVVRAPRHTGIGPVDNTTGIPCALRTTVDDSKHWYKNMFKQMHTISKDNEENGASEALSPTRLLLADESKHTSVELTKPTKVGRIFDYQPAKPYVVENEPIKLNLNRRQLPPPRNYAVQAAVANVTKKTEPVKSKYEQHIIENRGKPRADRLPSNEQRVEQPPSNGVVAPSNRPAAEPSGNHVQKPVAVGITPSGRQEPAKSAAAVAMKPLSAGSISSKSAAATPQQTGQQARAKFDFTAHTGKELSVKRDEVVTVLKQVDDNWYLAENSARKQGIVPVQYVKLTIDEAPTKPAKHGKARAKFDFTGKTQREISFKKGDEIRLVTKVDANWYKAKLGTTSGIVPAVYIDVISEPEAVDSGKPPVTPSAVTSRAPVSPRTMTSQASPRSVTSSSSSHAHSLSQASSEEPDETERKQRAAFLAGQVVRSGPQQLTAVERSPRGAAIPSGFDLTQLDTDLDHVAQSLETGADLPPPPAASLPPSSVGTPPASPPPGVAAAEFGHVIGAFAAQYAYRACNEDELDLVAGDRIQVVEICDDGWYVGTCERTRAFGTFPGNYVTPCDQ